MTAGVTEVFSVIWQNDQRVYKSCLEAAALLVPSVSDEAVGAWTLGFVLGLTMVNDEIDAMLADVDLQDVDRVVFGGQLREQLAGGALDDVGGELGAAARRWSA